MNGKGTILVVDDLTLNRRTLHLLLERLGFEVLEAENGAHALEILESDSADLILMDCHMPVMDGFEAASLLRRRRYLRPIIAYTTDDNRSECLEAGMDDHLLKPAPLDSLRDRVEYWMGREVAA